MFTYYVQKNLEKNDKSRQIMNHIMCDRGNKKEAEGEIPGKIRNR